jgi:hypothetical protein
MGSGGLTRALQVDALRDAAAQGACIDLEAPKAHMRAASGPAAYPRP